jgi:predicted GNAT family acetyltransferase
VELCRISAGPPSLLSRRPSRHWRAHGGGRSRAGAFKIRGDKDAIGFTAYKRRGGLIAFIHTKVGPEHKREGVASRLILGALDAARKQGLAVLSFCPFVRGHSAKHSAQHLDLGPRDLRRALRVADDR